VRCCIYIQPCGIIVRMNVLASKTTFGSGLNPAQLQAATFGACAPDGAKHGNDAGPLLIIAGAGTGKTNTLAHRVAFLLLQRVAPERIALLTFTRRVAQEMLQRAERIAHAALRESPRSSAFHPNATRMLWSGTFHSIGNRLLREYAHVLGLDPSFSVIDRGDSADLIDLKRHELGFTKLPKRFPRKDTCLAIYSHRVNTRGTLAESLDSHYPWCAEWRDELTRLFRAYVQAKQAQQLLDYDDLLLYWHLLTQDPSVAGHLGERFEHVLVDEYQDTNTLQAEILLAMKPDGAGLCVVGDDAQAIYSFRAAAVENILEFPARFTPPAQIVTLDRNYRSLQPILDAANALMSESTRQYQKRLHSEQPSAQKPWYVTVEDDRNQCLYVVEQVLDKREQGTPLKQQAVLMRSAHHSDVLEIELVRRNIPYVKYGGLKFLEAAHVKDVLALLRFIDNPRNRLAGFRALQLLPGIGPAIADRCLNALEEAAFALRSLANVRVPAAAEHDWQALVQLLGDLHDMREWPGQMTRVRQWYEPHLERLYDAAHVRRGDLEQLDMIAAQSPSRERFITELTLDPPQVTGDEAGPPLQDEDYLILSTVHSAKGQEWDSVFVLNVNDGSFPNEFAAGKPALVEEERRLLYVAMTRAKRDLHLVAPLRFYVTQQSRWGDKHVYGARSRFLTEPVLAAFESRVWPTERERAVGPPVGDTVRIDAAARLLDMWNN
jgi:DNA helicase-2/ATP-dependent DNA helicase PcrA